MSKDHLEIGIAGAGIAGLMSGILLQQAGHRVKIFESRRVPGGRIQSQMVQGYLIEAGPEFVHGNGNETIRLLKKYRILFERANGKMYYARKGGFEESEVMTSTDWVELLEKMNSPDRDLPFGEFLRKYFPGAGFEGLRNSAIRFAEGFDLADIEIASTKGLAMEWMQEEPDQFRIPSGYHTLIRAMADEFYSLGGEILFEHVVESVTWYPGKIRIGVRENHLFMVDKLVISLPITMLNQSAPGAEQLYFIPSLEEKQKAFSRIGFGDVIKIVMIWESAFWKSRIPGAQFIFSETFISTWWTQHPLDLPLLTGWIGGPAATDISDAPDDFFLGKALESLSNIFSIPEMELKKSLKDFRVFNWKNEPWTRGAYSYSLVDSEQAKALCRQPVESRIYFSGEAIDDGLFPGTVEAALLSGLASARQLLGDIK